MKLTSPLRELRGVGPARQQELAALGLNSLRDLLAVLPVSYEDWRRVQKIAELREPGDVLLRGRLLGLKTLRTRRKGLTLVRGILQDGTGELPAVWFNRPYLANQIDPGIEYFVHGQVRPRGKGWEISNASISKVELQEAGGIIPVYPALGSIGPKAVRGLIQQILEAFPGPLPVHDPIPAELLERHGLPGLGASLRAVHCPAERGDSISFDEDRDRHRARMAYGELLELQLVMARARSRRRRLQKGGRYLVDDSLREKVREMLPFPLTGAQKVALREIVNDLRDDHPMGRLLQGDVGSGKTIVAVITLMVAAHSGHQAAFMAPTEILAEQLFANLSKWMGDHCRIGLLTGSSAHADEVRRGLASGGMDVVVGTQALLQDRVVFRNLTLVVVDEQHRFGVAQRQALCSKGRYPDLLVMTATPIPRSLAMTVWGDLDRSVIDELPPGRLPVVTDIVPRKSRRQIYRQARDAMDRGEKVFVVLPRIEARDDGETASIHGQSEEIRGWLGPDRVAIVHGRLSVEERASALGDFSSGRSSALLATTVIEVGIDIPEASFMVIESAEIFGLAQLHQLRGRVGRGETNSRCVAIQGKSTPEGLARLEAFRQSNDGFELAERDLALRGPGDLLGLRQAGTPMLESADLVRDRAWIERASADARALLPRLGDESMAPLREAVDRKARLWRRIRAQSTEN